MPIRLVRLLPRFKSISFVNEGRLIMLLGKESRQHPSVIIGIFSDDRQVYAAQSLLTDFNYPRECMTTVVMGDGCIAHNNDRKVVKKMKKSAKKTSLIGAITGMIIGAIVGAGFCAMIHGGLPDRNAEIAGMIVFLLVEVTIGCFFGALLWAAIQSDKPEKNAMRLQKAALRGKILISVAPRTSEDAIDIAREWKNISDHILQH